MVTNFPNMCNPFVEEQKLWYKFVWLQHWVLLHPNDSQKEFQTKFFKFGFQWGFTDSINFSNTIFFFFCMTFSLWLSTPNSLLWTITDLGQIVFLYIISFSIIITQINQFLPFQARSITVHVCISYDAYP